MKALFKHPSESISKNDVMLIRSVSPQAEQMGMLHEQQLAVVYRNKWFQLLVPEVYNGLQITLPDLVRLQEAISWADGSVGWVVTLCSGAGWFGGFLSSEIAPRVFNNSQVCLAGSGAASGTAELTENGYTINGAWKYASGVHHATHITANCTITKNGKEVIDQDGQLLILPFIVDKKDVALLPAWKYTGMVATGSDAFTIKDLHVAFNRQFKIEPASAIIDQSLYQYPFLQLAEATLAVNLSGIAIHFMDLCEAIFHEKIKSSRLTDGKKEFLMSELNRVKVTMEVQRKLFFEAVDQSWETIKNTPVIPNDQLNGVSITSRKLAAIAREGVDRLYPLCGLQVAGTETEINRAWRDLHTASQHSLLTFAD